MREIDNINEVIDGAKQVVNGIYEHIGRIDSCNAVIKVMDKAEVSLLLEDGALVDTNSALSVEQRAELLYNMRSMIKQNIDDAAAVLESIQIHKEQQTAAVHPDAHIASEKSSAASESEEKEAVASARRSRMDKETVLQLLRDGYSLKDIADKYGYKTEKTVRNFCDNNKINLEIMLSKNDRTLTDKDIPQIKALYTNGPFNLTQTALELGVTKKYLRAFVEEKHILKPVKD